MAKKQIAESSENAAQEVEAKASAGYSPAQLYKIETLKAKADAESAKRKAVLATVKAEAGNFKPELRGQWIDYAEKSGVVSPALIIAERFKQDGEDLKLILTLYVFSPATAVPYKAERTF